MLELLAAQMGGEDALQQAQMYLGQLVEKALGGDPLTLVVLALGALLVLGMVAKLTTFLWKILKRIVLLAVAGYSLYYVISFTMAEADKVGGWQNLSLNTLGLTALGVALALITLVLGLSALLPARKAVAKPVPVLTARRRPNYVEEEEGEEVGEEPEKEPEEGIASRVASKLQQSVAGDEKSLLAVLAYLIVAEFGVFSSFTTAAPSPQVGMGFFVVFVLGALLFLRNNYKEYKTGLLHLGFALVLGFALSVVLGHYWNNIPLDTLFSFQYFATSSLVALVTGVAVSLVLGSKG